MTWIAVSIHGTEAKGITYLLAGGELEPYTVVIGSAQANGLPGAHAQAVEPPHQLPSLVYDLYYSCYAFCVPLREMEMRYYPEQQLLHHRVSDRWYELASEVAAFMDAAIEDALAKKARGELEKGPFAATFRAGGLPQGRYLLAPYPRSDSAQSEIDSLTTDLLLGRIAGHIRGPASEGFIMGHVVETLSGPPNGTTSEPPAFVVLFVVGDPRKGIAVSGIFGLYDPPTEERAGRFFWPGGYSSAQVPYYERPYYETTPGFDALVAEKIAPSIPEPDALASGVQADSASSGRDDGQPIALTRAVGAGLAVVGVALGGGAGVLYARRRRGARES